MGPPTTVDLRLVADSCQVHIVVHDSGLPGDEPRQWPTGLSVVSTVVSGSLGMKWASSGDAGFGLDGMAGRAGLHGGMVSAGDAVIAPALTRRLLDAFADRLGDDLGGPVRENPRLNSLTGRDSLR